jgi:hypothetical protein
VNQAWIDFHTANGDKEGVDGDQALRNNLEAMRDKLVKK